MIVEPMAGDRLEQNLNPVGRLHVRGPLRVVCHEHRREYRRCATVREMKEGPFGFGNQAPIPSHRKLLRSRAGVVRGGERCGNVGTMI